MKVFGVAGWSGSGKTTLVVKLIPELMSRGLSVSTVKHAHHGFEIDRPGKDSYEHRQAGATEVMVTSGGRWALMHELRGAPEPSLEQLIGQMKSVDLLLVEGFKRESHDKLEVHRVGLGKPLLAPQDPRIVAVAADGPVADLDLPQLALDDVAGIADFIVTRCALAPSALGAA
jgi:molybdopterin-guanine dinucleotide biosynthesis protein B